MNTRTALYKLEPITDDPRFEGFGTVSHPFPHSVPDRWMNNHSSWRVKRLRNQWIPLEVRGRVRKFNGYPTVGLTNPAFSAHAVEVLRDLLEPNGEILPLSSSLGDYFAFNVTTIGDVLEIKKSDIHWTVNNVLAFYIPTFSIVPGSLDDLVIFRLRQQPSQIYVTQPFVSRAEAHGLQGFNFIKVWPWPPGILWHDVNKQRRRARLRKDLPAGKTLKGNTLVIQLQLSKPNSKGTPAERKAVEKIMDQLDAMLVDVDSDAPPVGNLEGFDYGVPGECRLFLSCPDADALAAKLRPWLKKLHWPHSVRMLKRYGNFADRDAREETVKL
jgi:hypothetical protein